MQQAFRDTNDSGQPCVNGHPINLTVHSSQVFLPSDIDLTYAQA